MQPVAVDSGITPGRRTVLWVRALLLLVAIALVDGSTTWELGFSAFYLIPVLLLAWHLGTRNGFAMALLAGVSWYLVDRFSGRTFSHEYFRAWDATNHVLSYALTAWVVGALRRAVRVQQDLATDLKCTLDEVKELKGFLRMCAWCRKVIDQEGTWQPVETFIESNTRATFTHGVCPQCAKGLVGTSRGEAPPH
jgi:K+-sensing histidine kinase KdpD